MLILSALWIFRDWGLRVRCAAGGLDVPVRCRLVASSSPQSVAAEANPFAPGRD